MLSKSGEVPSLDTARKILEEAEKMNPGQWVKHSLYAGKAAEAIAKICLTHFFDCQDIREALGKWDCSKEEYEFVKKFIETAEYTNYDRLIQLCDALALPSGFCLIEKRMIDVALRHGIHENTINKWKRTFENKKYFEEKMGKSIYSLLDGVVQNTFGINDAK
ncbi:hypothetical protein AGR56_14945 [Clostridium sp. DMHC 10]|uniref:hypothetical protein n=1 Tax=Clostridium sp. DMHC 10 TaxID=747377 RepID=UPI00069DC414|nr:hypothetical protein [Clostridium sp. DMHC 10]KOF57611.1 hypothetical protein AGR56_14945 [Clostridium sp. DMHC 10]